MVPIENNQTLCYSIDVKLQMKLYMKYGILSTVLLQKARNKDGKAGISETAV